MKVQADAIRGSYDELFDAAEDISQILSAVATNQLDLTPIVQPWLNEQLERIELALAGPVRAAAEGGGA
jgi:hypothetical protein